MKGKTSRQSNFGPAWSVPVAVGDIPETGLALTLAADERARGSVAKLADLRALPRLEAKFELARHGRDGLHVVGTLSATVGLTCVVTLDPIENEIEESIDLIFAPGAGSIAEVRGGMEDVALDAPEPLTGGVVDLGAIATESLVLAIDPYPRKPGAVLEVPPVADDSNHPFAALAGLKNIRKRDAS
jgi:uncharacterized metal-binding protein YceD (DUF177 family)